MPWNDRIRRRLKLRDLDILTALIDSGSMGKAASRLGVSQPAVSKAIAELESALGVRLVDRSRRGIVPTPYGLALKQRSVSIFNDLRQGVADIDFLSDPTKAKSESEPLVPSWQPSFRRRLIAFPGNFQRSSFMSFSVTQRCCIERWHNETLNWRFAGCWGSFRKNWLRRSFFMMRSL